MAQIIGYRKDRLGARIIALGNLLFLEGKFGAEVRYLWPDGFETHDMAIENPENPIFDPVFAAEYIQQISMGDRPDIDNLTDIDKVRGRISAKLFEERLAKGERFLANEGLEPLLFSNEMGPTHAQTFRQALARIEYAEPIVAVLAEATAKLRALGKTPLALHVRRGDVLDKDPWCHKNWVSKFAPDEFYEAVMDRPDTATLLFSDTPAAAARLAAPRASAITLDDLLDTPHLSEMQRDLVELLLMAQCDAVVAPSLSAFSSSAALMTGMGVISLPRGLPEDDRLAASDRLLNRVLQGPASFHNDGDFAQSLGYAFKHALKENRHQDLYDVLKDQMNAGQDYAFYLPLAMALAMACGQTDHARALHDQARKDPNIWLDDLMICHGVGAIAEHQIGSKQAATAQFLRQFLARRKTLVNLDSLANYFLAAEPAVRDLFMIDDITQQTMQLHRLFLFPDDPNILNGAMVHAYPFWLISADWPELFESERALTNASNDPPFAKKGEEIPKAIKQAEIAFFRTQEPLPEDPTSLALLSVLSVALGLSGRYRRATPLMFHCRKHAGKNPLFYKRLANRFVATGQLDKAARNLDMALKLAPGHIGLVLARAQVAQAQGQHEEVDRLLCAISDYDVVPFAVYKTWEKSLRKLKSRKAARDVIAAAAKRYPDHKFFQKQWKGKL